MYSFDLFVYTCYGAPESTHVNALQGAARRSVHAVRYASTPQPPAVQRTKHILSLFSRDSSKFMKLGPSDSLGKVWAK